jgi:hypothetical protein
MPDPQSGPEFDGRPLRCRPALQPARPDFNAARYATTQGHWLRQAVLFTDGGWRPVTVLGELRGPGAWLVLVCWCDADGPRHDWLQYDPGRLREPGAREPLDRLGALAGRGGQQAPRV